MRSRNARAFLEKAVRELETRTRADVVIVVRPHSGDYRDLDHWAGMALMLAALLAFGAFGPDWSVSMTFLALPLFAVYWAGTRFASAWSALRRALARPARLERQVRTAAWAEFSQRGIDHLPSGLGLLVYASLLERRAVILPGRAIEPVLLGARARELEAHLAHAMARREPVVGLGSFARILADSLEEALPLPLGSGHSRELDSSRADVGEAE